MHRTRTGKRIELTRRDIEIFRLLERYRYLRSTFIHAFVGGASETRFKERLGHLYHEGGYLDRPREQWQFADARFMPVVYENTQTGREVLRQCGALDIGPAAQGSRTAAPRRQFAHSLMVCEILASIELAARADPELRFIPAEEILAKAPEATRASSAPFRIPVGSSTVVPDAMFGIEYEINKKKSYRFFALEADRATMPVMRSNPNQTSYAAKMRAYKDMIARQIHKSHLGIPNLMVLTVTTSETHMEQMMKQLHATDGGAAFLFKAIDSHRLSEGMRGPDFSILRAPWKRAGYPPLHIATL